MAITNPYIYGHPVREKEMFFGREDVFQFLQEHLVGAYQDNVVMLYGQRRTGKTSILYQILNHNRLGDNYVPVLISLEPLGDAETNAQIFWAIASEIALQLNLSVPEQEKFDPINKYFCYDFLGKVKTHLNNKKLLLMIDEYEKLEECVNNPHTKVSATIFSQFRHVMQHYDWISFLWVGSHKLEELNPDYWKEFTGAIYHRISFLDPRNARKLVEQPAAGFSVCYKPDAIQQLIELSGNHPLFLQALCHFAYTNGADKGEITKHNIDTAIKPCIEAIRNLYASIWRDFKDDEKVILSTTAHLNTHLINVSDIVGQLDHFKVNWKLKRIKKAVQQLEHKDVFKKNGLQQYQYCASFFRRCVKMYESLENVLDELNIARKRNAAFVYDPKILKAESYLRDAEQYAKSGNFKVAEKTFRYVIDTCHDYIGGWLKFGKFYESQGEWDNALELYKRRLQEYPDSVDTSNAIGLLLKRQNQFEEALEQFQFSQKIDDSNLVALTNIEEISQLLKIKEQRKELMFRAQKSTDLNSPEQKEILEQIQVLEKLQLQYQSPDIIENNPFYRAKEQLKRLKRKLNDSLPGSPEEQEILQQIQALEQGLPY